MSGNINFDGWINDDGSENYKCRAWVNFNGQGTVAIRASGGVSSITDIGTGNYTVNFTNAMPDANYIVEANASLDYATTNIASPAPNGSSFEIPPTINNFNLYIANLGQAAFDSKYVYVAIFR